MHQRDTILETITRLFWHADHHEWDDLLTVFADHVRLDYTSLQGGEPADLEPADIVAAWKATFEAIDAHQHLVTNHLVTVAGTTAAVTAAFQATHQYRDDTWTLGGDYRFELVGTADRWRIAAMTMTAVWQIGNADLLATAAADA